MDKQGLYHLTMKLFECSKDMKEVSEKCSDILLQMASETVALLEKVNMPEELKEEVESIKLEILGDD